MFQVVNKKTGAVLTVYGIAGIHFLFWNAEENCWQYGNMENYRPLEE